MHISIVFELFLAYLLLFFDLVSIEVFAFLGGQKMIVYKVIDEQNHSIYAFQSLEIAQQEVKMLNESREDHYFFIEPVEILQTHK